MCRMYIWLLQLVMDSVPEIGFSGATRNQPKNGVEQDVSSFFAKILAYLMIFSKLSLLGGMLKVYCETLKNHQICQNN